MEYSWREMNTWYCTVVMRSRSRNNTVTVLEDTPLVSCIVLALLRWGLCVMLIAAFKRVTMTDRLTLFRDPPPTFHITTLPKSLPGVRRLVLVKLPSSLPYPVTKPE
jgi:hypothetical protein